MAAVGLSGTPLHLPTQTPRAGNGGGPFLITRINWSQIRHAYVQGLIEQGSHVFPTIAELAEKYGCTSRAIELKSAQEHWREQRSDFIRRISERYDELVSQTLAEELSETSVTLALRAFWQFRDVMDMAYRKLNESLKPAELKAIVETMKTAHEQQRLVLGMVATRTGLEVTSVDWRMELLELLREGKITKQQIEDALGSDMAAEILES